MRFKALAISAILLLSLSFMYFAWATERAKAQAEAVCHAIKPGVSLIAVFQVIESLGYSKNIQEPLGPIILVFPSVLGERWVCNIQTPEGKVVSADVYLVD